MSHLIAERGRWLAQPLAVFLCTMCLRSIVEPGDDVRLYAVLCTLAIAYLGVLRHIYGARRALACMALGAGAALLLQTGSDGRDSRRQARRPLAEPVTIEGARTRHGAFYAQGQDAAGQCVEVNGWPYWLTRGDVLTGLRVRAPGGYRATGCWRTYWQPQSAIEPSAFRRQIKDPVVEAYGPAAGGYLLALTWGDRSLLDPAWSKQFASAGTAHLVAVSGTHFIFVAAVLWVLLGVLLWPLFVRERPWLGQSRTVRMLALIVLMGAYAWIAGDTGAVLRAYIMAALALALPLLLRRRIPMTVILAWMGFLMAMFWPSVWQGLGMQLSFWITLAIILVAEARQTMRGWVLYALLAIVPTAASILILWSAGIPTAWNGAFNNILAIPVFEALIMPAAWLAVGLADAGLSGAGRILADIAVRLTDVLLLTSVPPGLAQPALQAVDMALAGLALAVAFGTIMSSAKSTRIDQD